MSYKIIKVGVIALCLMMLVGCSSNVEIVPIQAKILCPTTNHCQAVTLKDIKTNRDLALALDHALNQTDLCVTELQALTQCIDTFNQIQGNSP
ncbi:Rz1-like lysis system protein LysC [Lonepinella sp. BR2271]|uniref:Rz1-like lysis system protein LysC n=1 Tax=Lonepinella sp. BR2271 TaxID=3434550 RepID=UPI003F6E2183